MYEGLGKQEGPGCVLEQATFTSLSTGTTLEELSTPNLTEKLLTGMLLLNQNKQKLKMKQSLLSNHRLAIATWPHHENMPMYSTDFSQVIKIENFQ